MAKFKSLESNFTISTMVEHGTLTFFLDGDSKIASEDSIDRKEMILSPGTHEYQWQVNGTQGLTRYSIRLLRNGISIPGTAIGPKTLENGNLTFSAGNFVI